jgi:tRNA-dihydrouridine synthase B
MAGVIDPPYRTLLHDLGCPLSFTEMISARGVVEDNPATFSIIGPAPDNGHCGIQLFGSDLDVLGRATEKVSSMGFSMVDINAGCPKRKVHTQGAGGALLKKPDLLIKLVRRAVGSTDLPVGVKLRSGWKAYDRTDFGALLEALTAEGISYITIHSRTVEQGFRGEADPEVIGHSRERTDLPLIASGDVFGPDDVSCRFESGADAVMVGRALMGDPEWFARFKEAALGGPWTTYRGDRTKVKAHLDMARRHLDLQIAYYGESKGVRDFRPHMSWYLKGLKDRALLHDRTFSISDRVGALSVLDEARTMWLDQR